MSEMNIVLNTQASFDAAHRLVGYSGHCKNLHGHKFIVDIRVCGLRSQRNGTGLLMDFRLIKALIKEYDHKTILWDCQENAELIYALDNIDPDSIVLLSYNPTAENLAMHIWKQLKKLDEKFQYNVVVWESNISSASTGDISGQ